MNKETATAESLDNGSVFPFPFSSLGLNELDLFHFLEYALIYNKRRNQLGKETEKRHKEQV